MNKLIGILMLCVAAMAAACSGGQSDEPQSAPEQSAPMTFRAIGADAQSRCVQSPDADAQSPNADAQSRCATGSRGDTEVALGNQFAVFAWKTNAKGTKEYVMSKDKSGNQPYIVSYTDGQGWDYAEPDDQYLKYWDESAKDYTFYAIANYNDNQTSFANGFAIIEGLDGHNTSNDILECYYRRQASPAADFDLLKSETDVVNIPLSNGLTSAITDVVPLMFHRLLCEVHFLIYNTDKAGDEIPINKISIIIDGDGLYGNAKYSGPETFVYSDENKIVQFYVDSDVKGKNISKDKDNPTELCCFTELPQPLNKEVQVQIETPNGVFFGNFNLGNTQNGRKWLKNTVYTYTLVLTTYSEIILVDVKVDDWEEYDKKNDVIHTNW